MRKTDHPGKKTYNKNKKESPERRNPLQERGIDRPVKKKNHQVGCSKEIIPAEKEGASKYGL